MNGTSVFRATTDPVRAICAPDQVGVTSWMFSALDRETPRFNDA